MKNRGQLGRPTRRWEENIKVNLKEIICEDVDWIHLAQGREFDIR
jgi:hypothetical protein